MADRADFYTTDVLPMEQLLLGHEVADFFRGHLYLYVEGQPEGIPLLELDLPDLGEGPLTLSPVDVGRLFFAPDESLIDVGKVSEGDDGSPAGFTVVSDSPLVQQGHPIEVIAYRKIHGPALLLKDLHLRTVLLAPDAPKRLATVAFGLMATTAYRLGFAEITLFAAGRGPMRRDEPDKLVGYAVWPKFGFDAELELIDLQTAPERANAVVAFWTLTRWRRSGGRRMALVATCLSISVRTVAHGRYC
jgi:hypothetical protein